MGVIVEFVGCSGAGKTTLERKVRGEMCRLGIKIFSPLEAATPRLLEGRVRHESFQNIVLEVGLLPYIREVRRHYKDFLFFACRMLMKYADSPYYALSGFRGVWRRTASFVAARHCAPDNAVTLLDEGTIHIAHYLFGQLRKEPEREDVALFWRLAPKPELIVYARTPLNVLARRAQERKDPPRRRLSQDDSLKFFQHADESFEFLRSFSGEGCQWITMSDKELNDSLCVLKLVDTVAAVLKQSYGAQTHC